MGEKQDVFAMWKKRDSQNRILDTGRLTKSPRISGIKVRRARRSVKLPDFSGGSSSDKPASPPQKIMVTTKLADRMKAFSSSAEQEISKGDLSESEEAKRPEFSKKRHEQRRKSRPSFGLPKKQANVAAAPIGNLAQFVPPVFEKSNSDVEIIERALKNNFVFENLNHSDLTKLTKAFEKMRVHRGQEIIKQGDTGDYFYIIGDGKVRFEVNGNVVGSAMYPKSFGELSLLYSSVRAASVIAEQNPTVLFRVDQKTFRFIMQSKAKESESEKMDLLKGINFLKDFNAPDLQRLCDCMVPRHFEKDDVVVKKGEVGEAFYVLQKGMMKVEDISVGSATYEDVTLSPGDYFGERALITSEPRAADVVGVEEGTCFLIDRDTFEKVLGNFSSVILRSQDKVKLEGVKVVKEAALEASMMDQLAAAIVDQTFKRGDKIQERDKDTLAALYLIREGTVDDDGTHIVAGGYFGEESLLADAKDLADRSGLITSEKNVVCKTDVVCGILKLKDCRAVFDTKGLNISSTQEERYSFSNCDILKRRSTIKNSFINNDVKVADLQRETYLGEGEFGSVWIAKAYNIWGTGDEDDYEEFALKVQNLDNPDHEGIKDSVKREIDVISSLEHPFIVDLVSHQQTESESLMVMTIVRGGELWDVVHKEDSDGNCLSGISENDAKFYSLIIADTIAYMHHRDIIFRDLKPENILIDSEGYPNIIDFGFAKFVKNGDKTYTFCGTPNFVSPEIVLSQGHSVGVDHWALGVMIYEMIAGENPFYYDGVDNGTLFEIIAKEEPFPCEKASKDAMDLINGLLQKDPTQRIGVLAGREADILQHKWFDELDLDLLRGKVSDAPWVPTITRED